MNVPKLSLAGHPLHTLLNEAPLTLLPFSLIMDVLATTTDQRSYADAANYARVGVTAFGLLAGAAGFVDYLHLQRGTHEKRVANLHAALNVTALTLTFISGQVRRRTPTSASLTLLSLANVCVIAGAWYGGNLVYDHGIRVKKAHPFKNVQDVDVPGGEQLKQAFEALPPHVPAGGPEVQADQDPPQ
ncbi:DUF2231 domain-containing protein [Deinococcus sp. YIM 77859]|uniref:DUF2231 domain-containing protein n=1 Tax=Deinococcus sp. YIM 77859 TaxID=1540221 RepID=UPI000689C99D|nr:DUF2231 domain-containing protein [Deinococcus sp. YIM 77859]